MLYLSLRVRRYSRSRKPAFLTHKFSKNFLKMEYILLTCIGILLGIAISQFLQISKLWKRVNVMFDSIFTNHNRLNDMEKQIDKIYGHLSWCEGRISESLPTPEDFSPINPSQTEDTPWE